MGAYCSHCVRHCTTGVNERTFDVERDLVGVVSVVARDDGAVVDALVVRRDRLDDETPLVTARVEVDADALVVDERVETDRQRVVVAFLAPRHLETRHQAPRHATRHERVETDRQRVVVAFLAPRHLETRHHASRQAPRQSRQTWRQAPYLPGTFAPYIP